MVFFACVRRPQYELAAEVPSLSGPLSKEMAPSMRSILAKAVWIIALMFGTAAAGSWGYFIWSLDWGNPSYRGRGLWLMLLTFPMVIIFPFVLFVVGGLLMLLWEAVYSEKFPSL